MKCRWINNFLQLDDPTLPIASPSLPQVMMILQDHGWVILILIILKFITVKLLTLLHIILKKTPSALNQLQN